VATHKQRETARKNVKKAQARAARANDRKPVGRDEAAPSVARAPRRPPASAGTTRGTGSGAGAMTVTELRREAARVRIAGRSKMGKAQLIRAVGQKRRSA
jgi:hypothetical protein